MAFDITQWAVQGTAETLNQVRMHTYKTTTDSISTVTASGYFNEINSAVNTGDLIWLSAQDGYQYVKITSANGVIPVTSATYVFENFDLSGLASLSSASPNGSAIGMIRVDMPGGASNTQSVVVPYKLRVWSASGVVQSNSGQSGDTITIYNNDNAITNALSLNITDGFIVRPVSLNYNYWDIDAGSELRLVQVDASGNNSPPCQITIDVIRVP